MIKTRPVACLFAVVLDCCSAEVPLCEHMVEYLPACGHSISVKCSLRWEATDF